MKDIQYSQLKKDVESQTVERELTDSSVDFSTIPLISNCAEVYKQNIYENDLKKVTSESKLIPYTEMTGNFVLRGIKTIVAKLTNFFVRPLVDHQGDLNDHYAELFAMVLGKIEVEEQKREELEKQLELANERIATLEAAIKQ